MIYSWFSPLWRSLRSLSEDLLKVNSHNGAKVPTSACQGRQCESQNATKELSFSSWVSELLLSKPSYDHTSLFLCYGIYLISLASSFFLFVLALNRELFSKLHVRIHTNILCRICIDKKEGKKSRNQ